MDLLIRMRVLKPSRESKGKDGMSVQDGEQMERLSRGRREVEENVNSARHS